MLGKLSLFAIILSIVVANVYYVFVDDITSEQFCNITMGDAYNEQKNEFVSQGKKAFVLGGTGEVGKELVKALLKEGIFSRLVLIGRRQVVYEDELYKNLEQRVIDFDKLENHIDDFKGFDVGYSCLGTTRGKSGADGFYKVDHDYVVNTARLAADGSCSQFHLVTSAGANKNSMFLYPQTKGQVEEELKEMKFDSLFIYRPAMLLCDREEGRFMESAGKVLIKPVTALFPTLLSVPTSTVARAMINRTLTSSRPSDNSPRVETLDNKEIHRAGKCE